MNVDKCCENCENFSENFYSNLGTCREYEGLVNPKKSACGWYCKKVEVKNEQIYRRG